MTNFKSSPKKILATILLVIFQSSNALAAGFTKPILDIGLSGFSLKEEASMSRGASTSLEARFEYLIEEGLKLNFWPVASFISGEQTSRDPQSPLTNSLYLKEASVEKELVFEIKIKAGALFQKDFLPAMSGQTKSFPAIGMIAPLKLDSHLIELKMEAAVPTSSGLATTTTELESNSTLYQAGFLIRSNWASALGSEINLSHFHFNNLSSQAAYDSLQRGNSVIRSSSSAGSFVYRYSGNEAQIALNILDTEQISFKLKGSYIKNDSAPKGINAGYYFLLSPGIKLDQFYSVSAQVEHYHVESDAIVATFSDTTYGRTNRDGYKYSLNFDKEKYTIQLTVSQSKLIQKNPFQSDDTSLFFNLNLKNIVF